MLVSTVQWLDVVYTYVLLQLLQPFRMSLLNVLAPEMLPLEELCALRYLAAPFRLVLLLDISSHLVFHGLLKWFAAELSDVDIVGLEQLEELLFICLNPVESALKLLLMRCY